MDKSPNIDEVHFNLFRKSKEEMSFPPSNNSLCFDL